MWRKKSKLCKSPKWRGSIKRAAVGKNCIIWHCRNANLASSLISLLQRFLKGFYLLKAQVKMWRKKGETNLAGYINISLSEAPSRILLPIISPPHLTVLFIFKSLWSRVLWYIPIPRWVLINICLSLNLVFFAIWLKSSISCCKTW